jgi:hypothetical protein
MSRQGINHFVQLADDSEDVPKLKNKMYSDFKLSRDDWNRLTLMCEVLRVSNIMLGFCSWLFDFRPNSRNRREPISLSQVRVTLPSGVPFPSWSICRRLGVVWSSRHDLQK